MKGSSKVIVGATLIMVVCLALVLGLVLVLLAELYCSLLFRQRRRLLRRTTSSSNIATTTTTTTNASLPATNDASSDVYNHRQHHHHQEEEHSVTPSLSSFYAHGVLHAPRSFLFPSVHVVNSYYSQDLEKQQQQQQHSLRSLFGETQTHRLPSSSSSSARSHEFIARALSLPPSPTTFTPLASPPLVHEVPLHCSSGDGNYAENNYIYICNPIYDNDGGNNMPIRVDTPFETPDSSPSRLETTGSTTSGEDNDHDEVSSPTSSSTPPLTPMKMLPAVGCSVSLRNARSLATSVTDSNNSNIYGISSSCSSVSPCTSPSW